VTRLPVGGYSKRRHIGRRRKTAEGDFAGDQGKDGGEEGYPNVNWRWNRVQTLSSPTRCEDGVHQRNHSLVGETDPAQWMWYRGKDEKSYSSGGGRLGEKALGEKPHGKGRIGFIHPSLMGRPERDNVTAQHYTERIPRTRKDPAAHINAPMRWQGKLGILKVAVFPPLTWQLGSNDPRKGKHQMMGEFKARRMGKRR